MAIDKNKMIKATINFEESWGYTSESVWLSEENGKYFLENSPFFALGYSYKDMVLINTGDTLIIAGKQQWGGHCTYRLVVQSESYDSWLILWNKLEEMGCTYEESLLFKNMKLIAVDIPPTTDLVKAYQIFELGEAEGIWEFEEADIGDWKATN